MSFVEAAKKTLLSYPKTKKFLKMKYWVEKPAEQIHMDTMFWKPTGKETKEIPILVIVDAATRFTKAYAQEAKNDNVKEYLTDFLKELHKRFKILKDQKTLLITDGARELKVESDRIKHIVSKNINKAVLAEIAIRWIRHYMREVEAEYEMVYLDTGKLRRINKKNIQNILDTLLETMNKKAKLREKPSDEPRMEQEFYLGQPVLIMNLLKYYPYQTGVPLRKSSYDRPWFTEPYYISKIINHQGLYKYGISRYAAEAGETPGFEEKLHYYTEQLKPIPGDIAKKYIESYIKYHKVDD